MFLIYIFAKKQLIMKEKQVFIKTYGWCKILKQDYKYALIQTPKGSNITYNILGHQTREL